MALDVSHLKGVILAHSHEGRTTEEYLDKALVLRALGVVPGQTILDAGCGYGYMLKEFARALKGNGRVYALDADPEAVAEIRAGTGGTLIEALESDVTRPTPLRPPLHLRFSPDDLRREVGLPPLETVEVGSHFYMQIFGNCQAGEDCDKDGEVFREGIE